MMKAFMKCKRDADYALAKLRTPRRRGFELETVVEAE
jgi:hypothetical protein